MKTLKGNRGAAVVEFAVVFLLLMIIVFGIIEFGFLWLQSHYIANSAREGARVAAKGEDQTTVENAVKEYLRGSSLPFYAANLSEDPCIFDTTGCCSSGGINGDFLEVCIEKGTEENPLEIEAGLGADNPGAVRVTVTVQTAEVWQPILWNLITLIPGASQIEINEVSEYAVFAVENQ